MKKLFNYALLAAALLVGVNVNAVDVATFGDLQSAIENAEASATVNIKLTADITLNEPLYIYKGQTIHLDMNEKNILAGNYTPFYINHGALYLEGKGLVTADKPEQSSMVRIMGSDGAEDTNYSVLNIGKDVTIENKDGFGIQVPTKNNQRDALGKVEAKTPKDTHKQYGVVVTIDGEVLVAGEGTSAIYINGTINNNEGNVPEFYINGKVQGPSSLYKIVAGTSGEEKAVRDAGFEEYYSTGSGIYAAGYAKWNITGFIGGGIGMYAKGGKFEIKDATIKATAPEFWAPLAYGNGYIAAGTAVILDSNSGYAGGIGVTVDGDTKITSDSGYGIQEVVTQGEVTTQNITIIQGKIIGASDKGALVTTEVGKGNTNIEGGTFNSDITQYLGPDNIVTPVDNGDGTTSYVIGKKENEDAWVTSINAVTKTTDYVKLTGTEETLSKNVEAEYLVANTTAKVTIPTGKTLTVGEIVMSKDAQIIVEKNAKLIVKGTKGIVANQASNIILKSEEGAPAYFLLDPDVTSNKTPKAQINFTSNSWRTSASEKEYQYFGAPTTNGFVEKITANTTYKSDFNVWNGATWVNVGMMNGNDDSELDYSVFNTAFGFYSVLSNNPKGEEYKITYTFSGNLYGNSNPEVSVDNGWAPMSNGFTGTMNGDAILEVLDNTGVDAAVYTPQQNKSGHLSWQAHTGLRYLKEVKPMSVFMLKNNASKKDLTLNYNDLVWAPAITPSQAPRANQYAMATIRVNGNDLDDIVTVAEDNMFSADFDNGYDAEKYDNEDICFFVNADKKYDIFATDNLNNTFVGLMTTNAGKYTISFEDVNANFVLVDNKTNARIEMVEGNTYEFLAEAGEDAYRFTIVAGAQAPTEMQKTNAAVKANKALVNGQIVISNGERFFNVLGTEVK
ncbi:MAG: hypothetical protein MJZ84_03655 [Paludibacteraceae bacterium]|nr:hypothetical protein [Paludibacteraceae bacterium]